MPLACGSFFAALIAEGLGFQKSQETQARSRCSVGHLTFCSTVKAHASHILGQMIKQYFQTP